MNLKRISGIQRRWLNSNISILVVIVMLVVIAYSISTYAYYYTNLQQTLESRAKTTTDFFGTYLNQSYNEFYRSCATFAETFEDKNRLELQFIKVNGELVASSYGQWSGQEPGTPEIERAKQTREIEAFIGKNPNTGERIMAVSCPMIYSNGEVIGILRFVTSLSIADREILLNTLYAILAGVGFVALILLSNRFFIFSIVQPITEINDTAKRIAAGGYGVQIQKQFDDEIGELSDTINNMSVKIAQTEKMQSEFISSVSHELRTPLTAISGWSETILSGQLDPEENRRGVLIILKESRRLIDMVEELLEFTRIQDGRFTLDVQRCDIRAEFEDAVFMYGNRLKEEGIAIDYLDNDDEIPEIPCDAARMRQVFLNILDNAAKHGGMGEKIVTEIYAEEQFVVIRIRDFGPGIPEDELPHVKLKFYKGSSKTRGSGIGLAVCEEIVTLHGGTLDIGNAVDGGTQVIIRLPVGEE